MSKDNRNSKVVSTKRNNNLEPISLRAGITLGYNKEIHEDDSIEFSYRLPLGAIKRLIKSYYEDILYIHQEFSYTGQTGSWEIRMKPYCNRMIVVIQKQLDKHNLNGKKIVDEVFDQYFKSEYGKMESYRKSQKKNK